MSLFLRRHPCHRWLALPLVRKEPGFSASPPLRVDACSCDEKTNDIRCSGQSSSCFRRPATLSCRVSSRGLGAIRSLGPKTVVFDPRPQRREGNSTTGFGRLSLRDRPLAHHRPLPRAASTMHRNCHISTAPRARCGSPRPSLKRQPVLADRALCASSLRCALSRQRAPGRAIPRQRRSPRPSRPGRDKRQTRRKSIQPHVPSFPTFRPVARATPLTEPAFPRFSAEQRLWSVESIGLIGIRGR